ncbi:MAG: helix-turn-helix domain-containing protein [Bacteroidetes bacterium]|nr:helix-turn-helix domain-containing protein [Bacteroidota bacterium]
MKIREKNKNETVQVKNKIEQDKSLKVAPFKKEIRKTTPHKHDNYFEIIYLSKGSGFHFIDNYKHKVTPPILYFVRKEQVHHWELNKEPKGFVAIIKKSFIERTLDNELKALFSKISGLSSLTVTDNETIENLFELLAKENSVLSGQSFTTTEGLLKALLSKILDVAKPILKQGIETKSDLYNSFISLLNSGKPIKNKVAHYAEILKTSPQNINASCRKSVNQPATEIISEFILSEAKRLLIYTGKSVSEIAYELDFSDPSHFVKFFKRITGQTPQHFRLNS